MEEFSLGNALRADRWFRIPCPSGLSADDLREILIGGQAFRWFPVENPSPVTWVGVWDRHVAALRLDATGHLLGQCLSAGTSEGMVKAYLAFERAANLRACLPTVADPVLQRLERNWGCLTLLQQPLAETLLAFICSANKQIPHIRQILARLSDRFGSPVPGTPFRTLPSWEALAHVSLEELRACALGYRAAYIAGTARFLDAHPGFLDNLHQLSTPESREALLLLPGVGPKVADCVLLFGLGRAEAFPVDTWIERYMKAAYPDLADWPPQQIGLFGRLHFGRAAGLAQQWMFADARKAVALPTFLI